MRAAAEAYKAESRLHYQGMKLGPTSFAPDEEKRRIADPNLRRDMARIVREAGQHAREAIESIEKALKKL